MLVFSYFCPEGLEKIPTLAEGGSIVLALDLPQAALYYLCSQFRRNREGGKSAL